MLVPSQRHTQSDLDLWHELEDSDRIHGARPSLQSKVERSLAAIRAFGLPAYIGTSWGKDSVVIAHLCRAVMPTVPMVHLRPSNHSPDCDAVRDAYFAAFPGQPYSEVMIDYGNLHRRGLPHQDLDRETDRLWYAAIRESGKPYGGRHILGIRADESHGRKLRMRLWGLNSPNGCAPIGWWTTAEVFGYLAREGLPVHPAYAMLGGGRWPRERLRVAEIGDTHGTGSGRREWEQEYYGATLRRLGL